jgi:hypothetical protein
MKNPQRNPPEWMAPTRRVCLAATRLIFLAVVVCGAAHKGAIASPYFSNPYSNPYLNSSRSLYSTRHAAAPTRPRRGRNAPPARALLKPPLPYSLRNSSYPRSRHQSALSRPARIRQHLPRDSSQPQDALSILGKLASLLITAPSSAPSAAKHAQ